MKSFPALAFAAAVALPAFAAPPADAPEPPTIEQLQQSYLACDRETSRGRLDADVVAFCIAVGEALKQRAFGGDFDALIAWWREARDRTEASVGSEDPAP